MYGSNTVANGGRLDDCHTSIFSLAELNGIRWCQYTSTNSFLTSPSEDPVLEAFSKCLASDILAVWRRSPKNSSNVSHSFADEDQNVQSHQSNFEQKKELWIFWWGKEPRIDEIKNVSGLTEESQGSWEEELSYECRTLLFKAIHNLVERCLLTENFVRLGKWFVKPIHNNCEEDPSDRLSCSFSFFLHGESSVCTSVEIAYHNSVERLNVNHLQQMAKEQNNLKVILAPYGLRGTLTGVSHKSKHDPSVRKVLEEWKPFYPMQPDIDLRNDDRGDIENNAESTPAVVEVLVAGVRMDYPSHYVLVPTKRSGDKANKHQSKPGMDASDSEFGSMDNKNVAATNLVQSMITSVYNRSTSRKISKQKNGTQPSRPPEKVSSLISQSPILASTLAPQEQQEKKVSLPSRWNFINPYKEARSNKPELNLPNGEMEIDNTIRLHSDNTNIYFENRRRLEKSKMRSSAPFHRQNLSKSPVEEVLQKHMSLCNSSPALEMFSPSNRHMPNMPEADKMQIDSVQNQINIIQPNQQEDTVFYSGEETPFVSSTHNHMHQTNNMQFTNVPMNQFEMGEMGMNMNKTGMADTKMPQDQLQSQEIIMTSSKWNKCKLPSYVDAKTNSRPIMGASLARPVIPSDNLDPLFCLDYSRNKNKKQRTDLKREWAFGSSTAKKQKFEDISTTDPTSMASMEYSSNYHDNQQNAPQYTVGGITENLAGMVVPSDPYAFEDDIDDNSNSFSNYNNLTNSSTNDIILKQNGNAHDVSYSTNGPSHMDQQQFNSTLFSPSNHFPNHQITSIKNKPITSLKDNDLIKVQASLDDMPLFENEDDSGIPTPPNDTNDVLDGSHKHRHSEEDGQKMFPTPPSQEPQQHFSPDGRVLPKTNSITAHYHQNMTQNNMYSGTDVTNTFVKPSSHLAAHGKYFNPDIKPPLHWEPNKHHSSSPSKSSSKVYTKSPASYHPIPDNYSAISLLPSQEATPICQALPQQYYSYTPSWQVQMDSQYMQPMNMLPMTQSQNQSRQCTFQPPPTPKTPAGSVRTPRTPSSVQPQQSPASFSTPAPRTPRTPRGTLGMEGLVSPSPGTSIATPQPGGGKQFQQLHSVQSLYSVEPSILGEDCKASSAYMNLVLSDSVLNLHRDQCFDQCAICVCNSNILSRDVDHGYLPSLAGTKEQYTCMCGFSAVRNRLFSIGAGLFLEDELEIAGKQLENAILDELQLALQNKNTPLQGPSMALAMRVALDQSQNIYNHNRKGRTKNMSVRRFQSRIAVAQFDFINACVEAINSGITMVESGQTPKLTAQHCSEVMHNWFQTRCNIMEKAGSFDLYRLLLLLQPVLQDAIQRKRSTRSFDNNTQLVKGPLTWREFCKDASRATSDPLPIPRLIAGFDTGFLHTSPYSLKHWEKVNMEPYSHGSNIGYIVMCPDIEALVNASKIYFNELSHVYESCRLGFHKPMNKFLKDGMLRVGDNVFKNAKVDMDELFKDVRETLLGNKSIHATHPRFNMETIMEFMRLYITACQEKLTKILTSQSDLNIYSFYSTRSNFHMPANFNSPAAQPMGGVLTPNQQANIVNKQDPPTPIPQPQAQIKIKELPAKHIRWDAHSIVIYMINPFSGLHDSRLSVALWYCHEEVLKVIPEPLRSCVVLQLIPVEHLIQVPSISSLRSITSNARELAFSTYMQCKTKISHSLRIKTMTSFGPIEKIKKVIKDESIKFYQPTCLYSPPYTLEVSRNLQHEKVDGIEITCNVLFVSYCVSHDQKWILASATDQAGECLQTFAINITVPPKRMSLRRKKRVSAKCEGLLKLWNSIVSIIATSNSIRWRIVIGRFGRLSHGEILEWSKHLSRRKLSQISRQIPDSCKQCKINHNHKHPNIITACLTSMEPEGSFRLLPDVVQQITTFGRTGSNNVNLKTPQDNSCTHIFVFPTSSTTSVPDYHAEPENENIFSPGSGIPDIFPELQDENDMFPLPELWNDDEQQNPADVGCGERPSTDGIAGEDKCELSQQPLALGYLVSTSPTGQLPDWFWSSCPHAQHQNPVFLRLALHIQTCNDDMGNAPSGKKEDLHMLDSHKTADVLRHVMENLNDLSWLTCDPVNRDRASCLPIHMVALMRLYHFLKNITR